MIVMKKILSCLAALCLLLSAASLAEEPDGSLQNVLDKGTLSVGFFADHAPMSDTDADGNLIGFELDVASAVCHFLGVELDAQEIGWDEKASSLSANNIDCVWGGLAMTDENAETFLFSLPYLDNKQVLIVRADSTQQTQADLAGLTLGVQSPSAGENALNAAESFRSALGGIAEFDTYTALLAALGNGDVDAALLDLTTAGHYMSVEAVEFRILDEALASERFGIGFRKDDAALADAVNAALVELAFNGVLEEISSDWFTEDITIIAEVVAMSEEH